MISRIAAHAVTLALATVIAWFISSYFEYSKIRVEIGRYLLEMEKDKVAIINLVRERETPLALALIDYYQFKFGKDSEGSEDAAYTKFLKAIADHISSAPGKISKPDPAASMTNSQSPAFDVESVRNQFFSANRREYSENLVDFFSRSTTVVQMKIVEVLLSSIIDRDKDPTRRYRINLYIALTFALLPKAGMSTADISRLQALRSFSEYSDVTFRQNVENAIAKQKS